MHESNLEKFIISYYNRGITGQEGFCVGQRYLLIKSLNKPTLTKLKENRLISDGYCRQISVQSCEDCAGIKIEDFKIEQYTNEKVKEYNLERYTFKRLI